jgi:tetratricopeptide (TPR) repeat protein
MGYTIYALDGQAMSLTRFDLTDYGKLINIALEQYQRGHYEASAETWEQVLTLNGNFEMAYQGIARALLRQGYYREAMVYFKLFNDYQGYGRAFGFYRRQWVEEHFMIFAAVVGILIVVPPFIRLALRIRREVRES